MDPGLLPNVFLIPILLVLLALNVAAEVAVTNISRLRLHQLLDRGRTAGPGLGRNAERAALA